MLFDSVRNSVFLSDVKHHHILYTAAFKLDCKGTSYYWLVIYVSNDRLEKYKNCLSSDPSVLILNLDFHLDMATQSISDSRSQTAVSIREAEVT